MSTLNFREVYTNLLNRVRAVTPTEERAAQLTIGGHFEQFGILERELLKLYGLQPDHYVIDIGCGSGRLTHALASYLQGNYLGVDVVPELLTHARARAGQPHWRFEISDKLAIPEDDGKADMICFFSVFTHLLHEQSYVYLQEAKRVLKPGGKIIFSFIEFSCDHHWQCFEAAISEIGANLPLYVFMERNAIAAWSSRLGLKVEAIQEGGTPFIPLVQPIVFDDGVRQEGMGHLGQSVCVLVKPSLMG